MRCISFEMVLWNVEARNSPRQGGSWGKIFRICNVFLCACMQRTMARCHTVFYIMLVLKLEAHSIHPGCEGRQIHTCALDLRCLGSGCCFVLRSTSLSRSETFLVCSSIVSSGGSFRAICNMMQCGSGRQGRSVFWHTIVERCRLGTHIDGQFAFCMFNSIA